MEKVLKIVLMLLVVAAVVFAAGCAGNTKTTSNATQGASEQVTPKTSVASEGGNQSEASANVPANTSVTESNITDVNQTGGNETNISAASVNATQSSTGRVSLTAMKRAKIRANLGVNGNAANNTTI